MTDDNFTYSDNIHLFEGEDVQELDHVVDAAPAPDAPPLPRIGLTITTDASGDYNVEPIGAPTMDDIDYLLYRASRDLNLHMHARATVGMLASMQHQSKLVHPVL